MTHIIAFLICTPLAVNTVSFKPTVTLQPVDENSGFFLERPLSFDIDKHGNYYLIDGEAKVVFSWTKDGQFRKVIGKPGQGPGEFSFARRSRATGFAYALDDRLFIFDGAKGEILIFDLEGAYQRNVPLHLGRGFISNFAITPDSQYLLQRRLRKEEKIFTEVQLLNAEGDIVQVLKSIEDDTFRRRRRGPGGNRSFTIKAFSPGLTSHFDRDNSTLLIGDGEEAFFEVMDLDGKSRRIKVPTVREKVSQADKDEFLQQLPQNRRAETQVEFPDEKPHYNQLLSLGTRGYLVYTESPFHKTLQGVHLNKDGDLIGRFRLQCGEGGALLASRGRTLCISLDSQDEFQVQELSVAP